MPFSLYIIAPFRLSLIFIDAIISLFHYSSALILFHCFSSLSTLPLSPPFHYFHADTWHYAIIDASFAISDIILILLPLMMLFFHHYAIFIFIACCRHAIDTLRHIFITLAIAIYIIFRFYRLSATPLFHYFTLFISLLFFIFLTLLFSFLSLLFWLFLSYFCHYFIIISFSFHFISFHYYFHYCFHYFIIFLPLFSLFSLFWYYFDFPLRLLMLH